MSSPGFEPYQYCDCSPLASFRSCVTGLLLFSVCVTSPASLRILVTMHPWISILTKPLATMSEAYNFSFHNTVQVWMTLFFQ